MSQPCASLTKRSLMSDTCQTPVTRVGVYDTRQLLTLGARWPATHKFNHNQPKANWAPLFLILLLFFFFSLLLLLRFSPLSTPKANWATLFFLLGYSFLFPPPFFFFCGFCQLLSFNTNGSDLFLGGGHIFTIL